MRHFGGFFYLLFGNIVMFGVCVAVVTLLWSLEHKKHEQRFEEDEDPFWRSEHEEPDAGEEDEDDNEEDDEDDDEDDGEDDEEEGEDDNEEEESWSRWQWFCFIFKLVANIITITVFLLTIFGVIER